MGVEPSPHDHAQQPGPRVDPHVSLAPAVYSASPEDTRRRRYALVYLLRLCLVGALIAVYMMGVLLVIMDTLNSCAASWSAETERKCYADNRIFLVAAFTFLAILAAFPICHFFGWLAVKKDRHRRRVLAVNIVGIVLSFFGMIWGALFLYTVVATIATWGMGGLYGIRNMLFAFIVAVTPLMEFVLSIIFVRYAVRMGTKVKLIPNPYQP